MKLFISKLDNKIKILIVALLFFLVMFTAARMAFWALIFIFVGSIAEIYNVHFRTPIHFDLVKLGTILSSVAYGAPFGIFVGLTASFFSKLFSSRMDFTVLISFIATILIAILADIFSEFSITTLGIVLVLLYYIITSPINLFMGVEPGYAAVYVLSSIAINIVLFTQVAPRLLPLL